ncbi:MAG: hypothetical protein WA639_14705 [Candidatus Acidiferrum sp.]
MNTLREGDSTPRMFRAALLLVGFSLFLSFSTLAQSTAPATTPTTSNSFRWIHENTDPQLWQQLQLAFADELAPDTSTPGQDPLDIYGYKYIQKVGLVNQSALVIIGRRPAKEVAKENAWDEYFSAFSFDFATHKSSPIEHAEVMWIWKFTRLARLGPSSVPDVTFTYYSCTECEPTIVFASFYYDTATSLWQIRSWSDGKDPWWATGDGLVVAADIEASDETLSFDCVYGILDLKHDGFQNVVERCKEITLKDKGRAQVDDSTIDFGLIDGMFKPRRVTNPSEYLDLTSKICKPTIHSWLCRLPGYMTATSGQNQALDQMFPNARPAERDFAHFRSIKQSMSMNDVARRCGIPDELGGSGISIFIYHLADDSLVVIGAADAAGRLLYANHIVVGGKSVELFTPKGIIESPHAATPAPTRPF